MNYCLIPEDSEAFWSFLSGLALPAAVQYTLRHSTIEKVEIDEDPPQWRIFLKTVAPIEQEALVRWLRRYAINAAWIRWNF